MNIDAMLERLLAGRIVETSAAEEVPVGNIFIDLILATNYKMVDFISMIEKFETDHAIQCNALLENIVASQDLNVKPTVYPNLERLLKKAKPAQDSEESLL